MIALLVALTLSQAAPRIPPGQGQIYADVDNFTPTLTVSARSIYYPVIDPQGDYFVGDCAPDLGCQYVAVTHNGVSKSVWAFKPRWAGRYLVTSTVTFTVSEAGNGGSPPQAPQIEYELAAFDTTTFTTLSDVTSCAASQTITRQANQEGNISITCIVTATAGKYYVPAFEQYFGVVPNTITFKHFNLVIHRLF